MKFNEQPIFSYASAPFFGVTLDQIFSQICNQDQFAVSGLADLKEYLLMCMEWNTGHNPVLLMKELVKPASSLDGFDTLYQQYRDGRLTYGRDVNLHVKVVEEPTQYNKIKEGPQRIVNSQFYLCTTELYLSDYFPSAGDLIFWRDIAYQVRDARCMPTDYFQNTAFPLWIFIDAVPSRQYNDLPATQAIGPNIGDQPFLGAPGEGAASPSIVTVNNPSISGDNFVPPAPDIGATIGWIL